MKGSFETLRHGPVEDGIISKEGKDFIAKRAEELFDEIKTYSKDTVVAFMPSNIGRTQETRDIFEKELKHLFDLSEEDFQILDLKELDTKDLPEIDKKTLITGFGGSKILGFESPDESKNTKELLRRLKDFRGDENLIARFWSARPEEMDAIKEEVSRLYPEVDVQSLNPSDFLETPEDDAEKKIRWMMKVLERAKRYFPENPVKVFGISHSVRSDFAVMKLLGLDISAKTFEEIGGARDYLESHNVSIDGDEVSVSFRGSKKKLSIDELREVLDKVRKDSEERKKIWEENNL